MVLHLAGDSTITRAPAFGEAAAPPPTKWTISIRSLSLIQVVKSLSLGTMSRLSSTTTFGASRDRFFKRPASERGPSKVLGSPLNMTDKSVLFNGDIIFSR